EARGCRSRTNARSRQLVRRRLDRLAGIITDAAAPILHLRGPILLGPEEERAEAWGVGGVIRHERPELPRGAEILELGGYVVPGLADLHCHLGIADGGGGTALAQAREQALVDRDSGVLLIRDAGSIIDTSPLQQQTDLPRLIRCGRHVARTRRYLRGYARPRPPPSPTRQRTARRRLSRCGRHVPRPRRYLRGYADEVEPEDLPAAAARQARRGDGWVKLVGDWIDRGVGDLTPCWE